MTDLTSTLERLYALLPRGQQLGLERVERVCAHFGNPQAGFEAVHVAGTNGKGSVCAFVAAMSRASGRRTGMYTSPHLNRFAERIQIDGELLDDASLVRLLNRVLDAGPDLTFFEVGTITAFLAFQEAGVDLAVLEVGLGGRLDATNVIPAPRVAVITRVAYDHMAELGGSLRLIAVEKAGIIKAGSKVVCGRLHPDALAVVTARCAELGAEVVDLEQIASLGDAQATYPRLAMFGSNLAVANTVARQLGFGADVIAQGIASTVWPGRNELLHRDGLDITLLDCAHNPDSAVALARVLDQSLLGGMESRRELALVFGVLQGKNWSAMLARLEQPTKYHIYVQPPVPNAAELEPMAKKYAGEIAMSVPEALSRARTLVGPQGVVVVTGSTYLVGAARAYLLGLSTELPVMDGM